MMYIETEPYAFWTDGTEVQTVFSKKTTDI